MLFEYAKQKNSIVEVSAGEDVGHWARLSAKPGGKDRRTVGAQ